MNTTLPFRHFKQRLAYHKKLMRLHDKAIPLVLKKKEHSLWKAKEEIHNFLQKTHTADEAKTLRDDSFREIQRNFQLYKNWNRLLKNPAWHYSVLYRKLPEHKVSLKALTVGFQTLGNMLTQDIEKLEQEEKKKKFSLFKLWHYCMLPATAVFSLCVKMFPANKELPFIAAGGTFATCTAYNFRDPWKKTLKTVWQELSASNLKEETSSTPKREKDQSKKDKPKTPKNG
ncbi:MAG: hypothetical protein FWF24_02075 [Alphaproteobacteria bacterium]|nr:hypothetical protein [Alphaproteobacteria bacterium]